MAVGGDAAHAGWDLSLVYCILYVTPFVHDTHVRVILEMSVARQSLRQIARNR